MRLDVHEIRLTDHDIWRSAREAIPEQPALLIELSASGTSGFGEASAFMTDHYNSDLGSMHDDLRRVAGTLRSLPADDPEGNWNVLAPALAGSPFVLAGVDIAAHDLAARLAGVPLWRHLGGEPPSDLRSSYSIGLDVPDVMIRKLRERPGWTAYKIKLAHPGDLRVLQELREHTSAPFYVDGNGGWELPDTLAAIGRMAELGVALLEQPFPRENWDAARALKRNSVIPVIADESITGPEDLDACALAFDGVNLKPMKAGGITPTLRMLRWARARGLCTMLGCMPESSAGVSATAHLGTYADYVDTDSIALLSVDTGTGIRLDNQGRISIPDTPGSGFVPDWASPAFSVRRDLPGLTGERAQAIVAFSHGKPVASVSLRQAPPPGNAVSGNSFVLIDPDLAADASANANASASATAEELTALYRTALTTAVGAGADVVWTRQSGPARAAGFTPHSDGTATAPFLVWKPRDAWRTHQHDHDA